MQWNTIFELAMDLLRLRDTAGNFPLIPLQSYHAAAPAYCTMVQGELLQLLGMEDGSPVEALTDWVALPDRVATTIAPWGLAALLGMESNPSVAAFCQARYEEMRRRIPAKPHRIRDVYGIGG